VYKQLLKQNKTKQTKNIHHGYQKTRLTNNKEKANVDVFKQTNKSVKLDDDAMPALMYV
jgi:hypothetical protein